MPRQHTVLSRRSNSHTLETLAPMRLGTLLFWGGAFKCRSRSRRCRRIHRCPANPAHSALEKADGGREADHTGTGSERTWLCWWCGGGEHVHGVLACSFCRSARRCPRMRIHLLAAHPSQQPLVHRCLMPHEVSMGTVRSSICRRIPRDIRLSNRRVRLS